ncbi:hypothetical protein QQS21_006121 [Conoideocrella luteorostrata]|uniref:Uncharacterized protein n=1 Tax=Conoideocrella luteorostrata TaxID=1105319 RepID=A0AAJ0CN61_9HYPO|nr:hypothetical protein QQS21_006121 [Conoideocrella luteorostrata]
MPCHEDGLGKDEGEDVPVAGCLDEEVVEVVAATIPRGCCVFRVGVEFAHSNGEVVVHQLACDVACDDGHAGEARKERKAQIELVVAVNIGKDGGNSDFKSIVDRVRG